MRKCLILAWVVMCAIANVALAQKYPPVFDYENMMGTYFDDESGLISFGDYTVAFAPEAEFNGAVAVVDSNNNVLAKFPFFPDYKWRIDVFARALVQGPAEITLTEPGIYNMVFLVDGKPVSRFPFRLEQTSAGDDPFKPAKTFRYDGLWRAFAYLTESEWKDQTTLILNLWVGGKDLPEGAKKDMFFVSLYRDGELVAHSQRTQGFIGPGHFKYQAAKLYLPHDEKTANPTYFFKSDWAKDGQYELRVTRKSDGAAIRNYKVEVANGEIKRLPATQFGYQPQIDYMLPRVMKKGASNVEMVEAIWIKGS